MAVEMGVLWVGRRVDGRAAKMVGRKALQRAETTAAYLAVLLVDPLEPLPAV